MKLTVRNSKSPLSFATRGGGSWEAWDRFITIDGKDAYHIGNICGTCSFFFRRCVGANKSLNPVDFQDQLSSGLTGLTDTQVSVLSELLPNGDYEASLLFRVPRLVTPGEEDDYFRREQPALWGIDGFWGLPHDPRTKYYRGADKPIADGARLFEFIIPMFPEGWLDPSRVLEFQARLQEGRRPTALAISVLDIKQPANWDGKQAVTSHWCLAHYVIDGHHKLFAASRAQRPVGLISMLALGRGVSSPEEHAKLITAQAVEPSPSPHGGPAESFGGSEPQEKPPLVS
jgi:hypothetical protein